LVWGSYLPQSQEWSEGIHVLSEGEQRRPSAPALSAAFAVFRRVSASRGPVILTRTAESRAIFDGLSAELGTPAASLCAIPIFRRRNRVAGELVLVDADPERFASFDPRPLELVAGWASAAFENALKFSFAKRDQDRLLLFAEATEEALWDWDLEKDEIWWSRGIQNLLGHGGATVEPHSQWKFARIHPSDAERVQQSLKQALASPQSSWQGEYRFRRADGSWAVVEDRGYFLRDADLRAYRIIGALRDVSELKKSNDRLRILSELSRTFAQATLTSTEAFDLIARTVTETLGDVCTIQLLSGDGARLETVGFHDVTGGGHPQQAELLKKTPSAAEDGFGGEALRKAQPLLLQSVSPEQLEPRVRTPIYRELWSDATTIVAAPMFVSGNPVGAIVMSRRGPVPFTAADSMLLQDIADRAALAIAHVKQTRALEQSERRFRSLAEASAQIVWTTAPDGWRVEDSPSWRAFTGQSHQQWRGLGWLDALHPEDRERVAQEWAQAVAQEAHVEMEYRVRRPDGSYTWTAARAAPVLNEDGSIREWVGTNTDITEKKRVEYQQRFLVNATAALAESLQVEVTLDKAAQVAVNNIADCCSITLLDDKTGRPRKVLLAHRNEAWAKQLRALAETLLGDAEVMVGASRVLRTGEPQLLPRFEETHLQALVAGHPAFADLLRQLSPRSLLALPMRVAGGRIVGAITLITTEESRRSYGPADLVLAEEFARRCALAVENAHLFQQAQEAIQVRDEFLSIASHELKTPLTPLQLQIHTLERKLHEYAKDEQKGWLVQRLGTIRRQSDRLNRLISALLDLSRIVGGRLQLEPERLDMAGLIQQVVTDFKDQGELTRARSEVSLQLDGAIVGRWDRIRLEQVITNLLSNALKYGSGQPVTISASLIDGAAQFSVEDRGIGIAPQDQERIFGRFERAVSVRHYGGLGLGLFIVWQIVQAMGGTVRVVSALGQGAKFTVQLPLEPPREKPAQAPQPSLPRNAAPLRGDAQS
jgi:PAS domain S-box-containing protein